VYLRVCMHRKSKASETGDQIRRTGLVLQPDHLLLKITQMHMTVLPASSSPVLSVLSVLHVSTI
jgi:hypothetical protein